MNLAIKSSIYIYDTNTVYNLIIHILLIKNSRFHPFLVRIPTEPNKEKHPNLLGCFSLVTRLGFGPRTSSLKGNCSTS